MKIFFLMNHLAFGGAENTVAYLSSYLADHGEDVVLYTMTNTVEYKLNPKIKLILGNLPAEYCNKLNKYINIIRRIKAINHTIRKEKPDIVFCIMAGTAKYLLKVHRRNYKLIVSERNNPKYMSEKEYMLENKIFKKANGIIFQTERVKENYTRLNGDKCVVIPNAVGNQYVDGTNWKIEGRNIVAAVGRLVTQKDYPLMITAFQKFLSTHRGFKLEIYGDGREKEKIKRFIMDNGLENDVILQGACPDAIKRISDARCYLLTSLYEGMPNSLMEAMAIGMPCISTDCKYGPGELIQNEESGLLVPVGNAAAISDAISRMVDDRDFAVKCGQNARKILRTNSMEDICAKYRDFFHKTANAEAVFNKERSV